jgi:cephalosporin hydroxylase
MDNFEEHNREIIGRMRTDKELQAATREWFAKATAQEYSYHFRWLGLPIIQFPQDIVAMQEVIWSVQPDLIIETGIARGGSLILHASILQLIGGNGRVLGIDIDIRPHNRQAIEAHPLSKRITMLECSSIAEETLAQVKAFATGAQRILVVLDSNHTHEHVLRELELYSPLVKRGSYLIVMDTVVEDMPQGSYPDRPWDQGDNPKTAVWKFLKSNDRFEIDQAMHDKLQITVAPDGWLKCVKN